MEMLLVIEMFSGSILYKQLYLQGRAAAFLEPDPCSHPFPEYYQPTVLSNPCSSIEQTVKSRRCLNIPSVIVTTSPIIQTLFVCGTSVIVPMMGRNS